jgi:hypothetical protein
MDKDELRYESSILDGNGAVVWTTKNVFDLKPGSFKKKYRKDGRILVLSKRETDSYDFFVCKDYTNIVLIEIYDGKPVYDINPIELRKRNVAYMDCPYKIKWSKNIFHHLKISYEFYKLVNFKDKFDYMLNPILRLHKLEKHTGSIKQHKLAWESFLNGNGAIVLDYDNSVVLFSGKYKKTYKKDGRIIIDHRPFSFDKDYYERFVCQQGKGPILIELNDNKPVITISYKKLCKRNIAYRDCKFKIKRKINPFYYLYLIIKQYLFLKVKLNNYYM